MFAVPTVAVLIPEEYSVPALTRPEFPFMTVPGQRS